jgi:hypothetical protein
MEEAVNRRRFLKALRTGAAAAAVSVILPAAPRRLRDEEMPEATYSGRSALSLIALRSALSVTYMYDKLHYGDAVTDRGDYQDAVDAAIRAYRALPPARSMSGAMATFNHYLTPVRRKIRKENGWA